MSMMKIAVHGNMKIATFIQRSPEQRATEAHWTALDEDFSTGTSERAIPLCSWRRRGRRIHERFNRRFDKMSTLLDDIIDPLLQLNLQEYHCVA